MAKVELNPLTDIPTKPIQITKTYMKGYVKNKGEDAMDWYARVVEKYIIEKETPSGAKSKTFDVAKVREEFIKEFFPNLLKPSKAETELDEILSWKK